MPSRRGVLAAAASAGVAGCLSGVDPVAPVPAAVTGKRIDGRRDGAWETVARCRPAPGYEFDHGSVPVDVPLAVSDGTGGEPPGELPAEGPLLADRSLVGSLREDYGRVRLGLLLTGIEDNPVDDRDAGTEAVYWVARGSFDRILVGDRVEFVPSEGDPHGVRSFERVRSVRADRGREES